MSRILKIAVLLMMLPSYSFAGDSREAIHASAQEAQPLMPGMQAPAFEVRDVFGNAAEFSPAMMEKPLVLTFFRGGWCPYCNLHLSEMRHAEQQLKTMGFDVWFISMDQPGVLNESLDEPDIGYELFSDSKLSATRAFGLAFRLDDDLVERYRNEHDIDVEAASGETHHVMPVPSTFIIGTDGIINFAYSNPTYTVRLHPDVLLAAAQAYTNDADARLKRQRAAAKKAKGSVTQ